MKYWSSLYILHYHDHHYLIIDHHCLKFNVIHLYIYIHTYIHIDHTLFQVSSPDIATPSHALSSPVELDLLSLATSSSWA